MPFPFINQHEPQSFTSGFLPWVVLYLPRDSTLLTKPTADPSQQQHPGRPLSLKMDRLGAFTRSPSAQLCRPHVSVQCAQGRPVAAAARPRVPRPAAVLAGPRVAAPAAVQQRPVVPTGRKVGGDAAIATSRTPCCGYQSCSAAPTQVLQHHTIARCLNCAGCRCRTLSGHVFAVLNPFTPIASTHCKQKHSQF